MKNGCRGQSYCGAFVSLGERRWELIPGDASPRLASVPEGLFFAATSSLRQNSGNNVFYCLRTHLQEAPCGRGASGPVCGRTFVLGGDEAGKRASPFAGAVQQPWPADVPLGGPGLQGTRRDDTGATVEGLSCHTNEPFILLFNQSCDKDSPVSWIVSLDRSSEAPEMF